MTRRYFGTDGIRGQVGQAAITVDFMLKLGWAFASVLAKEKNAKVLIGRDTRISGVVLQSALQAGLSAAGVDTYLLGVLPTPAIAHLTRSLRATAGIVISASHNPFQDNGIKFFDANGMKLSDKIELEIEAQLEKPLSMVSSESLGRVSTLVDAKGRYIEFCKSTFPSPLTLQGLKVVLDCANGATYNVAPTIFHELGAEVVCQGVNPDGVNINNACGATDVKSLQQAVVQHTAAVGIAFDGDGDRLIMVDHQGEVVDGDQILCILAKNRHKPTSEMSGVVGTLMSNLGLEQALQKSDIEFVRSKVGDRYVLEELLARQWTLGGESSGHIVDLDFTTTGDGIISSLQILRVMQQSAKSLHVLKQAMCKRPQVLINVPVYGMSELDQYPKITAAVKQATQQLGSKGRVLLRPSGTEPCLRVMVEGNDEAEIRQMAEDLASTVTESVS